MSERSEAEQHREIAVLHVDDEPELSELAATYLEQENERLTVETATNADDALDRLAATEFDCVVSDYDMPGRNGIELLELVRERFQDLPFILYTGKGSEEIASEAISAGVTEYLQKETGTGQYAVLANRISNAVSKHRSHTALNGSRKRLSLFIEQSPLGVLEYDEDFEIVGLNATGEQILGYTEAELTGRTWEALVTAESYEHVDAVTDKLSEAQGGYHSIDENVRKDGERIVCEWYNRVITDDNDEVVAVFSLFQDITERVERERALTRSKQKFETVFEHANDAIFILDPATGEFIDCNSAAAELLGVSKRRVCRDIAPTDTHPADVLSELEAFFEEVITDGQSYTDQVPIITADGAVRPVEMSAVSLELDGRPCIVNHVRDRTERAARKQEVEQQNQRLTEFTSGVGHDLRNPLQVALGRVELLKEDIESRHLNVAENALQRAEQLIDNLMTLSQSGEKIDSLAAVDLADAAEASWKTVPTERATLTVEAPGTVMADESRLRQLFENLFGNAVVHGGDTVGITVGATEGGFYVADDGPGIPTEERGRVFEPGYSTVTDGTGFGLRIVARIAEAHGWTVDIAESDSGGARIEVSGVETEP